MTQEQKELLLKDLCGRLPYGVNIKLYYEDVAGDERVWEVDNAEPFHVNNWEIEHIKPYLRPMSSMTDAEREEFVATQYKEVIEQYPCSAAPTEIEILSYTAKTFDWLNKNMFDFRGLMLMGLALEAPLNMYNIK